MSPKRVVSALMIIGRTRVRTASLMASLGGSASLWSSSSRVLSPRRLTFIKLSD